MVRDGRIFGLDTGACHGWKLTALCVPGFTVHAVRAHADHWSIAKRRWQLPILKTKPWRDFTWPELAEAIARYSSRPDTVVREWLAATEAWVGELRSSFPDLVAAAHRVADGLSTDELPRHPAAQFLFQARNGRLDETSLARQCATPHRTLDLAGALGRVLPELPE